VLRKFWLLFAQACTICLGALFVVVTLRPDLLPRLSGKGSVVLLQQEATTPIAGTRIASYADAARKAMPSVVNIYSTKAAKPNPLSDDSLLQRYFPGLTDSLRERRTTSLGSGVIVAREGYVLTNHHVVDGADDIEIVLADGRKLPARVRGSDSESDLAVLKVDVDDLPAITFGNMESLQVGDVVLAIGNPFGFGNTVTLGIVSALGRNHLGINQFEDFIQTDAAINPGNSGGALVDVAGNLVGINSTIFSATGGSQGIGFAIPISLARTVLEQIIRDGEVTRGWLGVEPQTLTPEAARELSLERADGVLIQGLQRNGPADRGGLHVRDVVLEIDGHPTHDVPQLLARIAGLPPIDLEVVVARRPKPQ